MDAAWWLFQPLIGDGQCPFLKATRCSVTVIFASLVCPSSLFAHSLITDYAGKRILILYNNITGIMLAEVPSLAKFPEDG